MPPQVVLIALVCLLILPPEAQSGGTAGGSRADPRARIGLFLDSGAMLGGEERLSTYQRSPFRIYTEGGFELRRPRSEGSPARGAGLALFFAPGRDDGRFGGGLRVTHDIGARWAAQGMVGLLASSLEEELGLFERGVQIRGSLIYRDTGSIGFIWHTLPYEFRSDGVVRESGRHQSLYAIGMLHGRPGAILSGAILGTYLVLAVALLASGGVS